MNELIQAFYRLEFWQKVAVIVLIVVLLPVVFSIVGTIIKWILGIVFLGILFVVVATLFSRK